MKNSIFSSLILAVVLLSLSGCKKSASPDATAAFQNIVPIPVSASADGGAFFLTKEATIGIEGDDKALKNITDYLRTLLKPATGFEFPSAENPSTAVILLSLAETNSNLGEEGYLLNISSEQIKISAYKPAGVFYGIQTLRQLLPDLIEDINIQSNSWEIATGEIMDKPTHSWRGSMLDVARHFFPIDNVKRYIDLLAMYKMNRLHLHLSDDQGWRIEIKSWPNLAKYGGSTEVGGDKGGFYTQEEYKELISYAQERYITIIPEIDMPGHINSALASYGELNGGTNIPQEGAPNGPKVNPLLIKDSQPTPLYTGTEVGFSTLRLEKEITFKFINDVIRELSEITPGPYFHVGGDEAHVTKKEDYIAFVNRFTEIVKANNKIMVGWEEIAQGNISENAIAQHWANPDYARMAAEKGAKIIMSPSPKVYLDMQYDSLTKLGLHWAAYIEADIAYNWDPATQVEGVETAQVLGVEAPLWSETIDSMDDIEYMLFPRITAVAEIGWSPAEKRGWEGYSSRIGAHGSRWTRMGINYYPSKKITWK